MSQHDSREWFHDVAAIVVHHRSYSTIAATLQNILEQGVLADHVVVVDNSEADPSLLDQLVPDGCRVLYTRNRGYGAAVNDGVSAIMQTFAAQDISSILVSTHEVLAGEGCLAQLHSILTSDLSVGAVGPALVDSSGSETIWSGGGILTPHLHLPRHRGHGSQYVKDSGGTAIEVDWLDGAYVLYRLEVLESLPIAEDYFLYLEEVDLHTRMKSHGWTIVCDTGVTAIQSSGGVPAYYAMRNLVVFLRRSFPDEYVCRFFAVVLEFSRRMAKVTLRKGKPDPGGVRDLLRGMLEGIAYNHQSVSSGFSSNAVIVNPLKFALHHYITALSRVLSDGGVETRVVNIAEPSQAEYGRFGWLWRVYCGLVHARLTSRWPTPLLVTWPCLGYFDTVLVRVLGGRRCWVVIHDPVPLVWSVGYGRIGTFVGRISRPRQLIAHSRVAADCISEILGVTASVLPLPFFRRSSPSARAQHQAVSDESVRILVFGQYKDDRNLSVLNEVGRLLSDGPYRLSIVGRGWPPIDGWDVRSEFVAEDEVNGLLEDADVVLIPYKRFFQSGVAFRCVEVGTPFVGPANSSLSEIVSIDSKLLVQHDNRVTEWSDAVKYASVHGAEEIAEAAQRLSVQLRDSWVEWVQSRRK